MRFVVLMDRIDDALRNLITFINENSRFDVFGVELQFYRFDDYEVTIPRLYGAEARKEVGGGSTSGRRRWDEASFYADAEERLDPEQLEAVRKLHAKCSVGPVGEGRHSPTLRCEERAAPVGRGRLRSGEAEPGQGQGWRSPRPA